jgi:hypothetical protein
LYKIIAKRKDKNVKNIAVMILILVTLPNLFSQDIPAKDEDYQEKILSGEKDLLDTPLDIFKLSRLDNNNLGLLKNMIYARHGYIFGYADLNIFFKRFDWYTPVSNNVDNYLTFIDKANIKSIEAFENRNENIPNITWPYSRVGVWFEGVIPASGWADSLVIHSNNKLEFHYSQMSQMREIEPQFKKEAPYSGMAGIYSIKGNVLEFRVDEIILPGDGNRYLKNPIIYKFPVSNIVVIENSGNSKTEIITLGGIDFYKFTDDINFTF